MPGRRGNPCWCRYPQYLPLHALAAYRRRQVWANGPQRRECHATVYTPPGEWHWHGASADSFMCHLAMWEDDDATWGDHVTDDEYGAVAIDRRD
jgi:hypothetical protein